MKFYYPVLMMLLSICALCSCGAPFELVAGSLDDAQSVDGPALVSRFDRPLAMASDSQGNLYITEASGRIRKLSLDGVVSTFAGNGQELMAPVPQHALRPLNSSIEPYGIFIRDDQLYFSGPGCINYIDLRLSEEKQRLETIWGDCLTLQQTRDNNQRSSDVNLVINELKEILVSVDHSSFYAIINQNNSSQIIGHLERESNVVHVVGDGLNVTGIAMLDNGSLYRTINFGEPFVNPSAGLFSFPFSTDRQRLISSDMIGRHPSGLASDGRKGLYYIDLGDRQLKKFQVDSQNVMVLSSDTHSEMMTKSLHFNVAKQEVFIFAKQALYKWKVNK